MSVHDFQFHNLGVFVSDTRNRLSNTFIHGVQSASMGGGFGTINTMDAGRSQMVVSNVPPRPEFRMERILSDYTDLLFYGITKPTSYSNSYFLKPSNFGHSITGNNSTDVPQFDIDFYLSRNTDTSLTGEALYKYSLKRALLDSINVSMSAGELITESLSFSSKTARKESVKTIPSNNLPIFLDGNTKKVFTGADFDKQSVLPSEVSDLVNNSTYIDNSLVLGLQNISISLNINYEQKFDTGIYRGSVSESDSNKWVNIAPPLDISCSFTVLAQKGHELDIKAVNDNISKEPIRIIIKGISLYYVFDLGVKNILNEVSIGEANTDGGFLEYTFTYNNVNNDFAAYTSDNLDFSNIGQTTERL